MTIWSLDRKWPGALLPEEPPSIEDLQTAPTVDLVLPQVLALTPRGSAWGSDEVGNPEGVSPVMAQYWSAFAAWTVDLNIRESEVGAQAFASAVTIGLEDWQSELGFPEDGGAAALRARGRGISSVSPADFILLAAAGGAVVTIEEPDQMQVGLTFLGPSWDEPSAEADLAAMAPVADEVVAKYWVVRIESLGDFDSAEQIEATLRFFAPQHAILVMG